MAIAKSFARIHWQNLVNFGVLPLTFADPADYQAIGQGATVRIANLRASLRGGRVVIAMVGDRAVTLEHDLSPRQLDVLLEGGVINWLRQSMAA